MMSMIIKVIKLITCFAKKILTAFKFSKIMEIHMAFIIEMTFLVKIITFPKTQILRVLH